MGIRNSRSPRIQRIRNLQSTPRTTPSMTQHKTNPQSSTIRRVNHRVRLRRTIKRSPRQAKANKREAPTGSRCSGLQPIWRDLPSGYPRLVPHKSATEQISSDTWHLHNRIVYFDFLTNLQPIPSHLSMVCYPQLDGLTGRAFLPVNIINRT
jgi:hypothetical protein